LQKRVLLTALLAFSFIVFYSCTKIDTTTQGADLVTIDNIITKSDTLDVDTEQGFFAGMPYINNGDSTVIGKTSSHIIGQIANDNLFGKTEASIFVQFKPDFFPFYFGNAGDTTKNGTSANASPFAGLDSVVLCLSYKGAWGDTGVANPPLRIQVLSINDPSFAEKYDTARAVGTFPLSVSTPSTLITQKDITLKDITNRTYYGKKDGLPRDSVDNQIRIRLDNSFAASLYGQDSSSTAPSNNAFNSDAKFRAAYKGFEIKVTSIDGKVLYYVNLAEAKTRLEVHYRKVRVGGVRDTLMHPLLMYASPSGTRNPCATANYIKRDYTGTPASTNPGFNTQYLFLQTSPGTYGKLKIPKLSTMSNRIIHRAYLIVDQVPFTPAETDPFTPPAYLYADLKDTVVSSPQRYKPVYFDLTTRAYYNPDAATASDLYFPNTNVDIATYGGAAEKRYDAGALFYRYQINLTRYVQHIVTNKYKNYDLRLYAPYSLYYPQYAGSNFIIPYYNPLAVGRVRVAGGAWPRTDLHKMRMVVVYSEVK
jgi:hypothetical protein